MIPVFLDFETFWSVTHSLTKMNPIRYIMHPDTELQSVTYAIGNGPIQFAFGEEAVIAALQAIDWSDKMAVAHNGAGFDHLILAWRLKIRPKAYACTLAMARPFYSLTVGGSLAKVASEMGLPPKGSLEAVGTKGRRCADFTPDEIRHMETYNAHDTWLCREIFNRLMPRLGLHEMQLIDATVKMATDLRIMADTALLHSALAEEKEKKRIALLDLANVAGAATNPNWDEDTLLAAMRSIVMSQPRFTQLLSSLGVAVPMKNSPTAKNPDGTPKRIPALSKTDKGMEELLEYDNGDEELSLRVRTAAAARLQVKTTQLETRLQTYIDVADALDGFLPVPLNYCGAAISWRMSGAMKMNMQNNPRIDPDEYKTSDALRNSMVAPPGKLFVVADSSNIELRVAHCLAGQMDTIEKLHNKEDLYCWFASTLYGRVITKKDKLERFIGKVAMLSLQYGSSWRTFQNMARVLSKGKVRLPDDECQNIVYTWRSMFPMITNQRNGIWSKCDEAIERMYKNMPYEIDKYGLCRVEEGCIITPNNHWLQYPSLHKEVSDMGRTEWVYGQGQNRSRIYGAHLFENICQHLARLIVMEQTLVINRTYPVALSCHDEAVFVVDEDKAQDCLDLALRVMHTPPTWWPELPVAAEGDVGRTYGDAK